MKRRSVRNFSKYKLSEQEISTILWSGYGITKDFFKTIPSAGATYPLELYCFTEEGVFHYLSKEHSIEMLLKKDLRSDLSLASLNQKFVAEASLNILICAVFNRTVSVYGERGYRYVYIEVGHCAQNIALVVVSLGLCSVCVGAFCEDKIKKLINLPKNIEPLYIISVGKDKKK
ncbi:MAG: SagB/ThcOx family dehydrogenase [Endomicrobia bacterium]|nr:SagB/ThcOx family dehydrogenase [Endomicrobiia bacterium]